MSNLQVNRRKGIRGREERGGKSTFELSSAAIDTTGP